MQKYRRWGLWLRIALPFLLFVAAGSIILCAWLYADARRESQALFATLARTNADFIRTSRLPGSERMAMDLGRILDMEVRFRESNGQIVPPLTPDLKGAADNVNRLTASSGVVRLDALNEAIATPIDGTHDLILIRPARDSALLLRPATVTVLVAFWGLSVVLAWTLTRGVVRPLRVLAARLPKIEEDDVAALPGAERNDEIGLLARTYLETHRQLVAEREKRQQAERLALLGKMATGLAHEINNPLSSIRMHAQLLETAKEPGAAVAETIPTILGEASKIESLVNQWMFLARPAPPQVSSASLGALVDDVVKAMQPQAAHARVAIRSQIPAGLRAEVDARRLRQAIGNIILNAIQAMPNGGTLEITGHDGENARIDFRDTGPGFSGTALAHYTDLFYSEKEGGMGIGLSVSSEILKAHHGALEVTNPPEGGARVSLVLPSLTKN